LFKDEGSGRCPRCGHRFANPGVQFGCAQWCAMAAQCTGEVATLSAGAPPSPPAVRLIQRIEIELKDDLGRLARALRAFQYAKELAAREGGDPQVIVAASLLLELVAGGRARSASEGSPIPAIRTILQDAGIEPEACRRILAIVAALQTGPQCAEAEAAAVADAYRLAAWAETPARDRTAPPPPLTTEAGRQMAQRLAEARSADQKDAF
jgi:hypothetical protein